MVLPALYPILDLDALVHPGDDAIATLTRVARELAAAGCTVMQYRAKHLAVRDVLAQARELKRVLADITWIMNDRADLCLAAGFAGVHVGQDDLSPEAVRRVVGPDRIVGCSTHNAEQVAEALIWLVDYIAIGPVFATGSKLRPDPVVGLEGVAEARRLLTAAGRNIPLVAIGGITRANAASVRAAGANSVAVIGDICSTPRESAKEFFRLMM